MLQGIRVIDFSQYLPGPHASLRLLNMGAEVIKVESPNGDPSRLRWVTFQAQNRGKKSVCLNLKEEEGRKQALELISKADVVLESFRPGVAARLGIGYDDAVKVNSAIVYCSLSGYGQDGPMHHLGSHDLNYMAISGVLSQIRDGEGKPVHPSLTFADYLGGIAANEAILAALWQRERTGRGSYLDIAIGDVMFGLMVNHIPIEAATGHKYGPMLIDGSLICYHIYQTSDGRFVSLGALEPKFWKNFCVALDKHEWIEEQNSESLEGNPIFKEVQKVFRSRSLKEWTKFSMEVDCCMAPILETNEVAASVYNQSRRLIKDLDGQRVVSTHFLPKGLKDENITVAPKLGEHNEELLILVKKNK